jgi:hypothetical protein
MPLPLYIEHFRTTTLRTPRFSKYKFSDRIITKPDLLSDISRVHGTVTSHPKIGWSDNYEKSGKHFSRRTWRSIRGSCNRFSWNVKIQQERSFKYAPTILW